MLQSIQDVIATIQANTNEHPDFSSNAYPDGMVDQRLAPDMIACSDSHKNGSNFLVGVGWGGVGQGGGKNAIRIFSHFPHFFSHFLGRSLSVMFKRIHSSGIV